MSNDYSSSIIWIPPENFTCPLGKLQQGAKKCDQITDLIQSETSWKLSLTSDWLMSAWKNVS